MTPFHRRMIAAFGLILLTFAGLLTYAIRVAPQMGRDSKTALDHFYSLCRARDYKSAHQMLSSRLQDGISTAQLQAAWTKFAAKNGALTRWQQADKISINGFGGAVCVFPPFVEFRHGVFGSKSTGTLIYTRMVPENGVWKLERFNFLRWKGL